MKHSVRRNSLVRMAGIVCGLFAVLIWHGAARAATLSIFPNAGTYAPDSQFTADVRVTSSDQPINAVSGTVSFPSDKLQVVSVSKTGSIISLWVQDPSFSNSDGTITFEGAILNPGFQGTNGEVVRITFRTLTPGTAPLGFPVASVLANDGQGTNVLQKTGTASFSISQANAVPTPGSETHSEANTAFAPEIHSATNPDSSQWYANANPEFSWQVASSTTAVRLGYGASSSGLPTVLYAYPVASKQLQNVSDGSWYFNVQLKDASGWGGVGHFKFNVDNSPPVVASLSVASQTDVLDPYARVFINAQDAMSGVDSYAFQVDQANSVTVPADKIGNGQYALGPEKPGVHTLVVRVIDRAGNAASASADFAINPLAEPEVSDYTHEIQTSEPLSISGTGIPGTMVEIWIKQSAESNFAQQYEARVDANGSFFFATQDIRQNGTYSFWLVSRSDQGAESLPTGTYSFVVARPLFMEWGLKILSILSIAVPVIALLGALFGMLMWGWRAWRGAPRGGIGRSRRSVNPVHVAFLKTYTDIANHMRMLEKTRTRRALTREEEYMLEYFRVRLAELERIVDQEIQHTRSNKTNESSTRT